MPHGKLPAIFAALSLLPAAVAQVIAFENVNVIPMDRERVIQQQTVIVRDGRIAQIGPSGRVKAPEGAVRVEASGKYLIPGRSSASTGLAAQSRRAHVVSLHRKRRHHRSRNAGKPDRHSIPE
jgi:predicted amidohydrolase YtcJ